MNIEYESLRPSILEAVSICLGDRRRLLDYGVDHVPDEHEMTKRCPDCDGMGYLRPQYWPDAGLVQERCRHAGAMVAMILERTK